MSVSTSVIIGRGTGTSKILVETTRYGGHNLPLLIEIKFNNRLENYGGLVPLSPRPHTFRRHWLGLSIVDRLNDALFASRPYVHSNWVGVFLIIFLFEISVKKVCTSKPWTNFLLSAVLLIKNWKPTFMIHNRFESWKWA